jgi:hypothetical protein
MDVLMMPGLMDDAHWGHEKWYNIRSDVAQNVGSDGVHIAVQKAGEVHKNAKMNMLNVLMVQGMIDALGGSYEKWCFNDEWCCPELDRSIVQSKELMNA